MAEFEAKDGMLYIDGKEIQKAWESLTGWYWFGHEIVDRRDSPYKDDDEVWFGYVQGMDEEWGTWYQGELEDLEAAVWEIKEQDLPYAGRR